MNRPKIETSIVYPFGEIFVEIFPEWVVTDCPLANEISEKRVLKAAKKLELFLKLYAAFCCTHRTESELEFIIEELRAILLR